MIAPNPSVFIIGTVACNAAFKLGFVVITHRLVGDIQSRSTFGKDIPVAVKDLLS